MDPEKIPERLNDIEKIIGHPPDENTKPLFMIIDALWQEIHSLKGELQDFKDRSEWQSNNQQRQIRRLQGWQY